MANRFLTLYKELDSLSEVRLQDLVEVRLATILEEYEKALSKSYDFVRSADMLTVIKELSKNEKSE